jgi:hypothetical protein
MAPHETDDALVDRLAEEYAHAINADRREGILVACRIAWEGLKGAREGAPGVARREQLAHATSHALARLRFPNDPQRQEEAVRIPANRPGGASVSSSAIAQRANAYSDVLAAGVEPTVENVTAAFVLASIGGSRGPREEVKHRVENGEDFIAVTRELSARLTDANRTRRTPKTITGRDTDPFELLRDYGRALDSLDDHDLGRLEISVRLLLERIKAEIARRNAPTPPMRA